MSDPTYDFDGMEGTERPGGMITLRLSIMMLLQYAVWGAWLPVAARYLKALPDEGGLGFDDKQIGMILGLAGSIGAVSAPFIAGQFADRYFRTERFLAVLMVAGGIVQLYLAKQTAYANWLVLAILYSVVFMPTLALSNSLAFAHIRDADRDFPKIRVWGTIGWIAASWTFPMIWLQTDLHRQWMPPFLAGPEVENVTGRLVDALKFSAILSFVYAGYCLLLPATPPKRNAVEPLAFAKAFRLFKKPSFAVLVLVSLSIATIHQIYFLQTSPFFSWLGLKDSQIGPAMTIGQFSEILMMALLGVLLKRFGFRFVLSVGAAAYFARYTIWGVTDLPVWLLVASQALHGICYACFFAASYIYVDRISDDDVRHSAQTVYGIMILGGGPVLGGLLSGWLGDRYTPEGGALNFSSYWYTVAGIALVTTLVFAALFRDAVRKSPPDPPQAELR
jgi:nucleoside transporter